MRVALIADLHGNLVAFEAVLADIEEQRPDRIVCLGDVAATGPQPRETLERLRGLNCPVVMGNADEWFLNPQFDASEDEFTRRTLEIDNWCLEQLTPDDLDYLRSFHPELEIPLAGEMGLLCFHGSPRSNTETIVATTPDEDLEQMLAGFEVPVMAGGHTHTPMLRRYRDVTLINPGSVGLPYLRARHSRDVRNPPWAEYAILSATNGRLNVEFRRVPVDVGLVVGAALDSGMPNASWWAEDWKA